MPADKEFDPWKLDTGLPTEFQGTVKEYFFTTDSDYNDGNTLLLKLEVQTDDPSIGDNGVTTLQFTCGDGWEAKDKGAKAAREDGKKKSFNENSGVGLLVKAAIEAGAGDVLRSRGKDTGPMAAGIWAGLTFEWERKEFTYKFDDGPRTTYRMLPVKFVGESGGKSPAKEAPEAEGDETPTDSAAESSNGSGLDAAMRAKLTARAKKAETHDQFIELCFDELDVAGNAELEAIVMDASDSGLFATANS